MIIEIEQDLWLNPEEVETVWTEIIDGEGETRQVHLSMKSGETFTILLPQTIEEVTAKINGLTPSLAESRARFDLIPQIPPPGAFHPIPKSRYPWGPRSDDV